MARDSSQSIPDAPGRPRHTTALDLAATGSSKRVITRGCVWPYGAGNTASLAWDHAYTADRRSIQRPVDGVVYAFTTHTGQCSWLNKMCTTHQDDLYYPPGQIGTPGRATFRPSAFFVSCAGAGAGAAKERERDQGRCLSAFLSAP